MRPDLICTMKNIYSHQFEPGPTHKTRKQHKTVLQEYPPVKHLLNDNEDHPNLQESNHELRDEKEHRPLNFKGSQWKLRQHGQHFRMERAIA